MRKTPFSSVLRLLTESAIGTIILSAHINFLDDDAAERPQDHGSLPKFYKSCNRSSAMQTRLDKLVAVRFGLSRRNAREAVLRGHVDVEDETCRDPGRELEPGVILKYVPSRPRPHVVARRLRVLYEDRHILVVDKPSGLLTQPTADREQDTLLERAGRYLARTRRLIRPYVGIVHRIDRDTSGAVLLVCDPAALRPFQSLFGTHSIERRYLAVVEGKVQPAQGTIDLAIAADRGDGRRGTARDHDPKRRTKIEMPQFERTDRRPRAGRTGRTAITRYEVVERFGDLASLITCRLETGRTHQIRIHLAEVGHSVVGDPVYRPKAAPPFPVSFARQALHAQTLGFLHPFSGQRLDVEAPVPADMTELISILGRRFGDRGGLRPPGRSG
jgi:23S rRNA pseudouridine1911/1915/1917 synthase